MGRREVFLQQMNDLGAAMERKRADGENRANNGGVGSSPQRSTRRRFRSALGAYRNCSLEVVFAIVEWRDFTRRSAGQGWCPFVWKERNYLMTMLSDTDMLRSVKLTKHFFQEGFLVRCAKRECLTCDANRHSCSPCASLNA